MICLNNPVNLLVFPHFLLAAAGLRDSRQALDSVMQFGFCEPLSQSFLQPTTDRLPLTAQLLCDNLKVVFWQGILRV